METKRTMTHASLFSGIGGAELAASWMGWSNLFHCELNPFCRKVLEYWFPNSTSYGDITTTDFTPWRGKIGILTGGFPCQPFSLAGNRKGAEDDRYLWPHMLRAIREVQPAWVVGENVAGILTMVQPGEAVDVAGQASLFGESDLCRTEQQYVIETICQDLEEEGYSVQTFDIPACAVGAPHRRDRLWIVARLAAHAEGKRDNGRPRQVREADGRPLGGLHAQPLQHGGIPGGLAAHAQRGGRGEVDDQVQPRQPNGERANGNGCEQPAPHALQQQGERLGLEQQEPFRPQQGQLRGSNCEDDSSLPADRWRDFPTQSPVCGRHDGLSALLDGISFPRWREESLKAYGNAMCPQVVYEIFRAIEENYE